MHIKAIITKSNKDPKIPVDPESSFDNLLKSVAGIIKS